MKNFKYFSLYVNKPNPQYCHHNNNMTPNKANCDNSTICKQTNKQTVKKLKHIFKHTQPVPFWQPGIGSFVLVYTRRRLSEDTFRRHTVAFYQLFPSQPEQFSKHRSPSWVVDNKQGIYYKNKYNYFSLKALLVPQWTITAISMAKQLEPV